MKKRLILLLQVLIAFVLIGTSVYATVNATLEFKADSTTLKRGEEISVTMSVKDVNSSETINSVVGYINYNKNLFEEVTVNSIVKGEDGKVTIGNESLPVEDLTDRTTMPNTTTYIGFNKNPETDNDIKITINFNNGISQNADLITLKFKVKENAALGQAREAIKYDLFTMIVGDVKTSETSRSFDIVVADVTGGENNSGKDPVNNTITDPVNNTVNNPVNNTVKDPVNNTVNNPVNNTVKDPVNNKVTNKVNNIVNKTLTIKGSTNTDNTIYASIIPAAGSRAVIVPAIILILCAYVCYNRYMKYKEF